MKKSKGKGGKKGDAEWVANKIMKDYPGLKKEEVEVDEAKKPNLTAGMECQECGKRFRAKLSTLQYGKTKCPKCKSTDLDFAYGAKNEQVGVRKVDFVDGVNENPMIAGMAAAAAKKELEKKKKKEKKEEAPTMSAGSGAIAGIGVGPQGEPPMPKKKKKKIDEAVITSTFAGKQVFVVDSDMYHQLSLIHI